MTISVYITSYNQKDFLREAIESVLNQTRPADEIIIVDDASNDGSQELIRKYEQKHAKIKGYFHDTNRGVAQVRRTALNNVTCDFVTYLDGDDIYLPNKLEVESDLLLEEDIDVAFSNNAYVAPNDPDEVKWVWVDDSMDLQLKEDIFVQTLTRDFPRNSLFRMELIRYSIFEKIGFHDPNLVLYEDYDIRIRLAQQAKFACSKVVTSKIRISEKGLSKLHVKHHIKAFEYIFRKYQEDIQKLDTETAASTLEKLESLMAGLKSSKSGKSMLNKVFGRVKSKLRTS